MRTAATPESSPASLIFGLPGSQWLSRQRPHRSSLPLENLKISATCNLTGIRICNAKPPHKVHSHPVVAKRTLILAESLGMVVAVCNVRDVWSDRLCRDTESPGDGVSVARALVWRHLHSIGKAPKAVEQITVLEQSVAPRRLTILQNRNRGRAYE